MGDQNNVCLYTFAQEVRGEGVEELYCFSQRSLSLCIEHGDSYMILTETEPYRCSIQMSADINTEQHTHTHTHEQLYATYAPRKGSYIKRHAQTHNTYK